MSFWLERACKHKVAFGTLQRNKCPLENEGPFWRWAGFGTHESASFASDTITVHPVAMERLVNWSRPGLRVEHQWRSREVLEILDDVQGEVLSESGSQTSLLVSYMGSL